MTQAGRDITDRLRGSLRNLSAFHQNQAGGILVAVAVAFPMILGMAALGFDATIWYMTKRQIQTVADNAALVGTIEMWRADDTLTPSEKQALAEAAILAEAERDGFVEDSFHDIIVNVPPSAGDYSGNANYVEVLVERRHKPYLSWMISDAPRSIQARAVGGMMSFGTHCVVSLDESADRAIEITGTAEITSACGIASNSSSQEAIYIGGKATLSADPAQAFGEIVTSGGATLAYDSPPQPLTERVPDPYADILSGLQADPSCVGVNQPHALGTAESPVSPGRFCGGIKVNGGDVHFLPGLYILDNGGFVEQTGNITGDGITFVLTAMHASDIGAFDIQGGTIDLRAPTANEATSTGGYEGMLFIQDPNVPDITTFNPLPINQFNGGSNMTLDGALYFPNTHVTYKGGASGGVNCTLIVSKTVSFQGKVNLNNDAQACQEAGIGTGIQQVRVRLFE